MLLVRYLHLTFWAYTSAVTSMRVPILLNLLFFYTTDNARGGDGTCKSEQTYPKLPCGQEQSEKLGHKDKTHK